MTLRYSDEELEAQLKANPDISVHRGNPLPTLAPLLKKRNNEEDRLQKQVIALLRILGYKVCEFRKARRMKGGVDTYITPFGADGQGFPDLFANRPRSSGSPLGRLVFIECKSSKGKLSPAQEMWKAILEECLMAEYYCVKPADFDELAEKLK